MKSKKRKKRKEEGRDGGREGGREGGKPHQHFLDTLKICTQTMGTPARESFAIPMVLRQYGP
jgi:hypothetical protein